MAINLLPDLIDKIDNAELIRDRVGEILAAETVSQVALATTAGKPNPDDWKYRVYLERSNPVELFMGQPEEGHIDLTPVVSVSWEGGEYDPTRGNPIVEQALVGIISVDVLAPGVSLDVDGGGHITGDEQAVRNCEFTARLVRNILMAAENVHLQLPGIVTRRWPKEVHAGQPEAVSDAFQFAGIGLSLEVLFKELSPQHAGNPLEYVAVDIRRDINGQIFIDEADYDYT